MIFGLKSSEEVSKSISLDFQRIQFTPDLLPTDLIGTMIFNPKSGDFVPRKGPVFTNIVLADEINRAPAKVQSALLEAMAEGLPIVATRVGGTDQALVDGDNGFVVPVRDVAAFAGALDRLVSDEALRARMGVQSQARVQEFSVDKMVDATMALYRELVGR